MDKVAKQPQALPIQETEEKRIKRVELKENGLSREQPRGLGAGSADEKLVLFCQSI
jgi:hypothetical protein